MAYHVAEKHEIMFSICMERRSFTLAIISAGRSVIGSHPLDELCLLQFSLRAFSMGIVTHFLHLKDNLVGVEVVVGSEPIRRVETAIQASDWRTPRCIGTCCFVLTVSGEEAGRIYFIGYKNTRNRVPLQNKLHGKNFPPQPKYEIVRHHA